MSILSRLKNKLQDPVFNETKIREFDECVSLLKNENVELHKRIDQLEALYKTNSNIQQSHVLEKHIEKLEQENERLFEENQYQRQEYERFLDQLATMVIQTAVMQENIRNECASIYHVIERLTDSKMNPIQINYPFDGIKEARRRILNNSSKISNELILLSSSSSSSLTNHRSISTSDSWTRDLSLEKEETNPQLSMSNMPIEEKQQESIIQRSETFTVSKKPSEELPASRPINGNDHPIPLRPSKLPCRCSSSTSQSLNQKVSKLPIRITTSLNRQQIPTKKSNIPTPIAAKTKKDTTVVSNRSIPSVNNSSIKKCIQPPPPTVIQSASNKSRSSSITTPEKNNTECPRLTIEIIESNDPIKQMKSTSSESSIEEQQSMNKLLPLVQDEGYSTWSSIDVKHDVIRNTDDRQRNMGFIKTWIDTTNRQCSNKPVKEVCVVRSDLKWNLSDPSSFVRNRCSNVISHSLESTTISFSNKDISLDSLDSSQSSSSLSSLTFSRSETFEKLILTQTLTDDLVDSTSSATSTFNMSDYIEDHFIDQDDTTSENSSSFETTITNKNLSFKPQKRLLFPGLLNRLIFFRRVLSDSDLQRREFYINENEDSSYVYHSNIINEHSVEVNLINTYGSDTELYVWSHDCAEQRRFLNERQQRQSEENSSNSNQQLAMERQILLQQIYEYPWLSQENDFNQTTRIQQSLISPATDLVVPLHNPDFYQLCALTNSSSFMISSDPNTRHTTPPTTSSVL